MTMDGKTLRDLIISQDLENKTVAELEREIDSIFPFGNPAAKVRAISDHILFKKLATFLLCLEETTPQQREAIVGKIDSDGSYADKVEDTLLQIVDRILDSRKLKITGILFKKVIKGHLSYIDFLRLSHALSVIFYDDILMLFYLAEDSVHILEQLEENVLYNPDDLNIFVNHKIVVKHTRNVTNRTELTHLGFALVEAMRESIMS